MSKRPDRSWSRRGSALIVVLLVLLALTALGMVALRTVGQTLDRAGSHRVRASASDFSDAAARYFLQKAPQFAGTLDQVTQSEMGGQSLANRKKLASRGGIVHLQQKRSGDRAFTLPSSYDETGLLTDDKSAGRSVESMNSNSQFAVVVRNQSHPISKPGMGDQYCYRKVTIAARATLGELKSSWDSVSRVGRGRTVAEGFVPVTNCN